MKTAILILEVLRFAVASQVICNSFVYIEDRLLSINYLHAPLDELTSRILLQILAFADGLKGGTFVGCNHFNANHYGKCNSKKYYKCIKFLETSGFMKTNRLSAKRISKTPLLAPLWSDDGQAFIDQSKYARIQKNIKRNNRNFALIPKDVLETMLSDKSISLTTIKLIMKLYKYNKPSIFTGIDPNMIHLKGDILYYDERIFHDLGIGEKDIQYYMAEFSPYFIAKEVSATYETLDKEVRLMLCDDTDEGDDTIKITILVPLYQFEKDRHEAITKDSTYDQSQSEEETSIWEMLCGEKTLPPRSSS